DHLPAAFGLQQEVEATEQRRHAVRMWRLLARQLDGRPRPGERRPPLGVIQNAVDGTVEQRAEGLGQIGQLCGFVSVEDERVELRSASTTKTTFVVAAGLGRGARSSSARVSSYVGSTASAYGQRGRTSTTCARPRLLNCAAM